jgi:hypothetical protein
MEVQGNDQAAWTQEQKSHWELCRLMLLLLEPLDPRPAATIDWRSEGQFDASH